MARLRQTTSRIDPAINRLRWARRFLLVAAGVQVPLWLLLFLFQIRPPQWVSFSLFVASTICAIIGFVITNRQLSLEDDALENSPVEGLLHRPVAGAFFRVWLTGSFLGLFLPRRWASLVFLRLPLTLGFVLAFFVPLVNLAIIFWTYFRAGAGIRDLERWHKETLETEKRRARLASGPAEAFRTRWP
jgi:hypothetical protein